jgi:hypothetical protein
VLFASLLGYNPVQTLLGHVISQLPASRAAYLTGRSFFPTLNSPSFSRGLTIAFGFAAAMCVIAALASLLRGGKYVHRAPAAGAAPGQAAGPGQAAAADPGRATSPAPGDVELAPGDAELAPGDAELAPGDAELAPGDAELAPGDAGSPALAGNPGPGGRGVSR